MNVGHKTKLPISRRRAKQYIMEFKQDYGRTPKKEELRAFIHAVNYHNLYGSPPASVRVVF